MDNVNKNDTPVFDSRQELSSQHRLQSFSAYIMTAGDLPSGYATDLSPPATVEVRNPGSHRAYFHSEYFTIWHSIAGTSGPHRTKRAHQYFAAANNAASFRTAGR
jgi:hypothetical protein